MASENVGAPRVFVPGAYMPNGGTYMAYHVARIFQQDFGLRAVAVTIGDETPRHGVFRYDPVFPQISIEEMERTITERDVLQINAGHSRYVWGPRLPGRKIMYVQGWTTYRPLDCAFDAYVSVSSFVQEFLKNVYGVDAPVVPPFIEPKRFPRTKPWAERAPGSIVVHLKEHHADLAAVRAALGRRAPHVRLDDVLPLGLTQYDFLQRVGEARYLLTVAAAEGFGLVPLEAMAVGTAVLGFDGFGGRDYLLDGVNCACARYGDFDGLADRIAAAVEEPARAEALVAQARTMPARYNYARFRAAWNERIAAFLAGATASRSTP